MLTSFRFVFVSRVCFVLFCFVFVLFVVLFVVVVGCCCCCWLLLLVVVVGCCWLLLLLLLLLVVVVVVGCCCCCCCCCCCLLLLLVVVVVLFFVCLSSFSRLACYYGAPQDKKATECVLLGADGEYKTHVTLSFTPKSSARDMAELKGFIEVHRPNVVAVGAHGFAARHLYGDLMSIVGDLEREGQAAPLVSWVDAEAAEIYWSTAEARAEFKRLAQQANFGGAVMAQTSDGSERGDGKGGARPKAPRSTQQPFNAQLMRALSVGRRLLDPLVECARLCNGKRDVCCLSLHTLQDVVSPDALYTRLERVFVTLVNAVGVDINEVLREPRLAPLLGFVAGLGPRKAQHALAEARAHASVITSRDQLVKYLGGEVVARNAIGFIKLSRDILTARALAMQQQREAEQGVEGQEEQQAGSELFDMTRIHPDDYNLASKIAKDAVERDDCENYVEAVMRAPEELERIDLDMFAQLLEQGFGQRKLHTLYDIKSELTNPFSDPREQYGDLEVHRLFDLLTGTTEETLYVGMLVKCRILMKKGTLMRRWLSFRFLRFV
jgi:transcription elongation factor SPT6